MANIEDYLEEHKKVTRLLNKQLSQREDFIWEALQPPKIPESPFPNLSAFFQSLKESLWESIKPAFETLQKAFEGLPPNTRTALLELGNHGWFFDLDMPISSLWVLRDALRDNKVEAVEVILGEHFSEKLDSIEQLIVEKYPRRRNIVSAAFNAHRRGEYELSIPVLLTQIDGICKEAVNQYFFIGRQGRPQTASYVEQEVSDIFTQALLSPLSETLPIRAPENQRPEGFNELNRHMILHGESLDYGTKTNSLKAVSLINYVVQMLDSEE